MKMQISFTNARNERVVLTEAPYFVTKFDGASGLDADVQTIKSPHQDGATYLETLLPARALTIEGAILASKLSDKQSARRNLLHVFSPKLGIAELQVDWIGVTRVMRVVVDQAPVFSDDRRSPYQKFLIALLAPLPFWLDPAVNRQDMADWVGGFQFPLLLPTMFAGRSTRTNTVVRNAGDVPTPLIITFRGGAVNPKIIHVDTGQFIQVRREIPATQELIIDTAFGNKRVLLRDNLTGQTQNAFAYIDPDSSFFSLETGDNQLNFSSDAGVANTAVQLRWMSRYLGI